MGNKNRSVTKSEKAHATKVIKNAFPGLKPVWGSHGDYGGHRTPRDHTISFRLQDQSGRLCSNVIWLMPDSLSSLTEEDVKSLLIKSGIKRRHLK